jgi:hypothetical protein
LNLDTLRLEIQQELDAQGIVVFHSFPRSGEPLPAVYWDTELYPDYNAFLSAAKAAGVKIITFFVREFSSDMIEDAWERLKEASLGREEHRTMEAQLRDAESYTGFTCQIELSFDVGPRVYIFDLRTDWFEDLSDLLDRIEDAHHMSMEDPDPPGPYFSKN